MRVLIGYKPKTFRQARLHMAVLLNLGGNRRIMAYVDGLRRPRARGGWIAPARSPEH